MKIICPVGITSIRCSCRNEIFTTEKALALKNILLDQINFFVQFALSFTKHERNVLILSDHSFGIFALSCDDLSLCVAIFCYLGIFPTFTKLQNYAAILASNVLI